jgi:Zinc carboxypeptidase/GEVED domain/Secretion system C-terminal sorting domain/Fibronectin type III domain
MYILPCVNPDGYIYNTTTNPNGGGMWRKNRKNNGDGTFGVDINRNYGYQWGYNNTGSSPTTSSDTYRGASAFSEPETQIIRNFCTNHDFVASMDFHSYGNYCIYPFGNLATNNNPEISLFQQMGVFLTAENGFVYGNANQTVKYTVNGAGDDWKYGEQSTKNKIYSFTPEIGTSTDGFYPASSRIIPLCESTLEMNRKILKLSSKFAALTSNAPASVTSLSGNVPFNVLNYGLRNPSYTITLSSASPYVSSLPASQTITNMALMQNTAGQFAFGLSPTTPIGSIIDFSITLDNGHSPIIKTISIVYDCGSPTALQSTSIGTSTATTSWTAVAGASGYYISYKTSASSTWSADSLIGSTSFVLSPLTPGTTYNWRVRTNSCNTYSTATFTTLLPCTNPTLPISSNVSSAGALLSWQAAAGANNYQIEYKSASSATWIVASAANTGLSYQLNGLSAATLYDWRVRSNCSSGNSTYTSAQFTTAIQTIAYCATKGSNSSLFWIDYFKLSNLTRTSGNDAGYYNGTASVANISKGVSNTMTFSPGFASTQYRVYWRIWIDYNRDGDFLDSNEQIASSTTTGATNYTANFTVPAAALVGSTRIRVSMKYSAYATSCETFSYGEVEDYTVNISATVASVETIANAKIKQSEESAEPNSETINVRILPNPTSNELYIDFKQTNSKDLKLKVVDISGKPFFEQTLDINQNGFGIDVTKFTPAVYFLILEKGQQRKSLKFVKN